MDSPMREKSYQLSLGVLKLVTGSLGERLAPVRRQLLRAGTSIGAIVEEAQSAESRDDFAHKIGIALKEARETHYWLRLSRDGGLFPDAAARPLLGLADEVIRMGSAIRKTTKSPESRRA